MAHLQIISMVVLTLLRGAPASALTHPIGKQLHLLQLVLGGMKFVTVNIADSVRNHMQMDVVTIHMHCH